MRKHEAVARDTLRNLNLLDFVQEYAATDVDRFSMEHYRPYIVMMNARARAYLALDGFDLEEARNIVNGAAKIIRDFCARADELPGETSAEDLVQNSAELRILDELNKQINALNLDGEPEMEDPKQPDPGLNALRREMQRAVSQEDFKLAAELRDKLKSFKDHGDPDAE